MIFDKVKMLPSGTLQYQIADNFIMCSKSMITKLLKKNILHEFH